MMLDFIRKESPFFPKFVNLNKEKKRSIKAKKIIDFFLQINKCTECFRSFIVLEVDDFERSIILQRCSCDDPFSGVLNNLLIIEISNPKVNLSEVLLYFQSHSVDFG